MSDYTIDWSDTNIDGDNVISGPDGAIEVSVSTPKNSQHDQWTVEDGVLQNSDVSRDSSAEVTFSQEVENVTFTLYDVDTIDEITIMTKDADGNAVEVQFEVTGVHSVDGNTVTGTETNAPGPGDDNSDQDINITIPGPVSSFWIVLDDGTSRSSGTVAVSDIGFDIPQTLDGTVEGTSGDDIIDDSYTGDPDGDMVDNDDAILAGDTGDDDLIYAYGGDDTVKAGNGDDEIYGGTGADKVVAGDGDDIVYGDEGDDFLLGNDGDDTVYGGEGDDTLCGNDGDDALFGGAGSDILEGMNGNDVAYGGAGNDVVYGDAGSDTLFGGAGDDDIEGGTGDDIIYGDDGDDADTVSGNLLINGALENDQADGTFDQYASIEGWQSNSGLIEVWGDGFRNENSTDGGNFVELDAESGVDSIYQDVTTVEDATYTISFDAMQRVEGSDDEIEVYFGGVLIGTVTPGDEWETYTFEVTGSGDDRLEFSESSSDNNTYGPLIDNIELNGEIPDTDDGEDGNDTIDGGDGADIIYGEGGDDTIDGGDGSDDIYGGDGSDTLYADADDTVVDGGAGGTDLDVLDLTGQGSYYLDDVVSDTTTGGNGNGINGTVVFVDEDGVETGETLSFTDIEEVIGDEVNRGPDAVDDSATANEDGPAVDIVLTGNDTDPDGDDLEIQSIDTTGTLGSVTVNADDDSVSYDANGAFENLAAGETATDTFAYTVEDGNGGTDTATVTVTITGENDDPIAVDDETTTEYGEPVTFNVVANDTDVDATDVLTVTGATVDPADGSVEVVGNEVRFTPAVGFTGVAEITYTIEDGNGGTDSAVLSVTVADAPLDGTVNGTAGDDLIDTDYLGDPDGDLIDANDAIVGDAGSNDDIVEAYEGDDVVYSGDGNDTVFGGTGDDMVFGGVGDDTLYGEDGNDKLEGSGGEDELYGGDGDDDLWGGANNDTVEGGAGNDTIDGGGGDDILSGGTGNDTIDGGNNDDMLFGGAGDDDLYGGSSDDKIEGGSGDDLIDGGIGDDDLWGASGDDEVYGGNGNDTIATAEGSDYVEGGDGDDIIDTSNDENPFTTDPGQNLPDVAYPEQDSATIPGLTFVGYDADDDPFDDLDTVYGGAGNDSILTGDDDDVIYGGDGNDTINAGIDDDIVFGGADNDFIEGGEGNDTVDGGEGDDTIYGGFEDPLADLISFPDDETDAYGFQDLVPENNGDVLSGGAGNDTIFGQDDDDTLYGGDGNDVLDGGIDDDHIFGEDGDDEIIGGQGADTIYGGMGDDTLFGGDGDDFIATGDGEDIAYGGAGDDLVAGNAGDDVLFGGDGDDTVTGLYGSDTITGGDGADLLRGGRESDTFLGGNGGDVVEGGEDSDGLDVDVLDLTGSDVDFITYVDGDDEAGTVTFLDGSTMTFEEIENVIPCFTPGTTIATPKGERLVEELREGDRIITRDNGIQEIRWVGRKEMTGKQLIASPHLKPILVRAGSLGNGLPERDMLVSPNHRMLVASDKTQLYFEEREVLAAAKHLVGSEGIHAVDVMGTAYIHFMFDQHEVVLSNGAWTESFQPGDYSLKGIGNAQRNEIFELFPELQEKQGLEGYQSARRSLKKHEARLLVR